ncbi:MAG: T9SS type A sorting domain-containing protein [Bacteroidota bacterium]
MKKITLSLLAVLFTIGYGYSQVNTDVLAPPFLTTSQLRAPNGLASQAGLKGCYLILQSELTGFALTNSVISTVGLSLTAGTGGSAVTGNFTVWIENTTNTTYQKGTTWGSGLLTGMQQVYAGPMTIPSANAAAAILLACSPTVPYLGGGLYVAIEWSSNGPFSANPATYCANGTGLTIGGATADTPTLPTPNTLATSNFRPSFIFRAANTATNEIQVLDVSAPGKVPFLLNTPHVITSVVRNASNIQKTNVPVTLNVTGANPFPQATMVSLAAGASTLISWPPFNPQNLGINTISVTVPADQNNNNNAQGWTQSVTCVIAAVNPPLPAYVNGIGFPTSTGNIGNKLIPTVTSALSGVRLAISNDAASVGTQVYGVLLSAAGVIVATTNTITITAGMAGTFQFFSFSSPQPVTAGTTYYVGMGLPNSGTFPIGSVSTGWAIPNGLYFTTPLIGGTLSQQSNAWFLGIEPVYGPAGAFVSVSQSALATCAGQPVTLNATGMSTYAWAGSTNTSGSSIVESPNVSTTYTITGTTSTIAGCPNLTSVAYLTHNVVSVAINATPSKTLICKGKPVTLTATGSASSYTWSGSTANSAAITITLNTLGNNTTTVYGSEPTLGCRSNTVVVTVSVSACTGISVNSTNSGDISIFPNPASAGKSEIRGLTGLNTITIYNLLGQAVLTEQTENENFALDFTNQANGTYLVKILNANNESRIIKVVNQN